MADQFRIRIEMRQIGSRQEASRLGGIGSCGRELCCSTWLTDFRSVSTSAARYQQLSLNPQKLAGQCGKLKCCLNYELDMYLDAIKSFPKTETKLRTEKGSAYHVKTDVFKRQMWYAYEGEAGISGLIPLDPARVREIVKLNTEGIKPKDLVDFVQEVIKEPDYTNVVGQDSLHRFEHAFKTKKKKKKPGNRPGERTRTEDSVKQPAVTSEVKTQQSDQNTAVSGQKKRRFNKRRGGNSKPKENEG
jgi:hypothetical protein